MGSEMCIRDSATVMASFTLSQFGVAGIVDLERGEYHARLDTYRRMVGLL